MKTKQLTLITLLLFAFVTGAFAQGFIEGTVYACRPLGVRHFPKLADILERQFGDALGHEQATAGRQPVDHGFREIDRLCYGPARVDVSIGAHSCRLLLKLPDKNS